MKLKFLSLPIRKLWIIALDEADTEQCQYWFTWEMMQAIAPSSVQMMLLLQLQMMPVLPLLQFSLSTQDMLSRSTGLAGEIQFLISSYCL